MDVMHKVALSLTNLELFFVVTTLLSLLVNILQWRDRRALQQPLLNTLRALFNDIKSKENNAFFVYQTIFNPNNPHKEIQALKWEYGLFVQSVLGSFQGFKETLVGTLVTLNPCDREGKSLVRALDYGLTKQEKEWREQYFNRLQELSQKTKIPVELEREHGSVEK